MATWFYANFVLVTVTLNTPIPNIVCETSLNQTVNMV